MLDRIKKLSKSDKGFTIIEVMIVLAIAGLIILIVFLAVPALQRNSRNTQRKNDVAAILSGVSEYSTNNNGTLPVTCSGTTPVQLGAAAASGSQAKVGYYNGGCVVGAAAVANGQVKLLTAYAVTGALSAAGTDYVVLVPAAACSTVTPGQTIPGSARAIAAVYEIESGSGAFKPVCQES